MHYVRNLLGRAWSSKASLCHAGRKSQTFYFIVYCDTFETSLGATGLASVMREQNADPFFVHYVIFWAERGAVRQASVTQVWNTNKVGALVAVFNTQGACWSRAIRMYTIVSKHVRKLQTEFRISDIPPLQVRLMQHVCGCCKTCVAAAALRVLIISLLG